MERFLAPALTSTYGHTGSTTISGFWDIDTLANGNIAIFTEDGALKASTGALSSTTSTFFTIARSITSNGKNYAHIVDGIHIPTMKVTKTAYVAPATKTMALGQDNNSSVTSGLSLNLPALMANGDTYGFIISNLDLPHENTRRNRDYIGSVVDSDVLTGQTSDNIIAKTVAAINADTEAIVTAAAVDSGTADYTGIVLTAKNSGVNFGITLMEGLYQLATISEYKVKAGTYDASYTTMTAKAEGKGTYAQMRKREIEYFSHEGDARQYYIGTPLAQIPSMLDSSGTYTQYVITWNPPPDRNTLIQNPGLTNTLLLAVKSTDSTLITILDALLQ